MKLKPCPFCGEEDEILSRIVFVEEFGFRGCMICGVCDARGPETESCSSIKCAEREAEKLWNERK